MELEGVLSLPPLQGFQTQDREAILNKSKDSLGLHLSLGEHPLPHPLESPGSCNFNKLQHRAHALPHHSLADFLAAIVQSLLHFPPSVGRALFAHSSPLKSQSSDPSEPAGASTSSSKSFHQKEGPLVHRAGPH